MINILKKSLVYFLLFFILIIHVIALTKLIYFPYPELFVYPYLVNHGFKPYSQILDQHFPGLLFLPINFDNLGLNTPEVARLWSIAIVVIVHLTLFVTGSKVLKGKKKAIIVNILYLIWQPFFEGWILWIDSFLPLMLLPAFYCLYKNKLFICGLLIGAGIVFKQTLIPLSLLIFLYIHWQTKKFSLSLSYFIGLFIPVTCMLLYLYSIGVISDFWYWTVVFNLTTYREFGRGAGPTLAHLIRVSVVFGLAFLLLLLKRLKTSEEQIILIFLVGALFGLSTRFDFVHFQPALPFAILATVFAMKNLGKLEKLGISALYGLVIIWWLIIFYKGHLGDRIISFDSNTKELAVKIREYTNPGEKIFVFGAEPHLYQISDTLPAGNIFVFQFPWFLQAAGSRILDGIIVDKPNIIVSERTAEIEGMQIKEFAPEIDKYIQQNYQVIDKVGSADIMRRKNL